MQRFCGVSYYCYNIKLFDLLNKMMYMRVNQQQQQRQLLIVCGGRLSIVGEIRLRNGAAWAPHKTVRHRHDVRSDNGVSLHLGPQATRSTPCTST